MRWSPSNPVNVLLVDNTDGANGMAGATLDFGVIIYATPPENHTSINYYDDWLKLVIYHEYAHILNMDATRGGWRILRWLTGPVSLPNAFWPRWMLEGLAVVIETRFSGLGRGRSPYWEAILRSAVAESKLRDREFITLDRVNGVNPEFPEGGTPYLFGYHLMNHLVMELDEAYRQEGKDPIEALGTLSERSSSDIPYFLHRYLEQKGPQGWSDIWESWLASTEKTAYQQLEQIRSQPVTPLKNLTPEVPNARGTVVSRDGRWIAYSADPDDRRASVYILDRKTGEQRRIQDRIMGATSSFLGKKDSGEFTHLIYSHGQVIHTFEQYNDLMIRSLTHESAPEQRLTEGMRIRDPEVSPDEDYVLFAKVEGLAAQLYGAPLSRNPETLDWSLGTLELLYDPGMSGVVSQPRISPDGKKVVFSVHSPGSPSEELYEAELAVLRSAHRATQTTASITPLVKDGSFNRFGSYREDGTIVYVSDRSGVDNAYLIPLDRKSPHVLLSNVETGIHFPQYTPDGKLIATEVRWKGTTVVEFDPNSKTGTSAPNIRNLFHRIPGGTPGPTVSVESPVPHPADSEYQPWKSLKPRAWYPSLDLSSADYQGAGGGVLGYDAVDRHRYWTSAMGGKILDQPFFDFAIAYDHLFASSILGLQLDFTSGTGLVDLDEGTTARSIIRDRSLGLTWSRPFIWTYSSLTPAIETGLSYRIVSSEVDDFSTWSPRRWGSPYVLLKGDFFTGESTRWSISTDRGYAFSAASYGIPEAEDPALKLVIGGTGWFSLNSFRVLTASFRAAYAPVQTYDIDRVLVTGISGNRSSTRSFGTHLSSENLVQQFIIRGYPQTYALADLALAGDFEFRMPIIRLFRGLGVLPAFTQNLSAFAFAETTSLHDKQRALLFNLRGGTFLPSAGAGLKLTGTLFYNVPFNAAIEYQYGFNREMGGGRSIVGAFNTSLPF